MKQCNSCIMKYKKAHCSIANQMKCDITYATLFYLEYLMNFVRSVFMRCLSKVLSATIIFQDSYGIIQNYSVF